MRLIRLGIAPAALAGLAAAVSAQEPAQPPVSIAPPPPIIATPAPPAPAAQPPAPSAPYRRCGSAGRYASIGTCALRVVPGRTARLQVRIERSLPARPAAIILIWSEREGSGGVIHRLSGRALGDNPGQGVGTILSVAVPDRYCAPTARPFQAELEVEGGRNLGVIGRFTFPCSG